MVYNEHSLIMKVLLIKIYSEEAERGGTRLRGPRYTSGAEGCDGYFSNNQSLEGHRARRTSRVVHETTAALA